MLIQRAVRQGHPDHRCVADVDLPAAIFQELALGHRERDEDRVLAHDGREHAAVGPDQVADAERGAADPAGDRGVNLGVAEIDLRLLERRLRLLDLPPPPSDRAARRWSTSDFGNVVVLDQLLAALQLRRGVGAVRLGARELGPALGDDRLVRLLLDHEQEVAGANIGALLEQPLLEKSGDPRAQLDLVDGDHAAIEPDARRDLGRCKLITVTAGGGGCCRRGLLLLPASPDERHGDSRKAQPRPTGPAEVLEIPNVLQVDASRVRTEREGSTGGLVRCAWGRDRTRRHDNPDPVLRRTQTHRPPA